MGSKEKHGAKIYNAIVSNSPKFDALVDLFCGGFAVGELFLKAGYNVIANDKNKYVTALLDKVINEGLDREIVTQFIDREKFFDVTKNPDNYENWYVGFAQCCWSFGNNQVDYLYGKDKEAIKRAGQELVINSNTDLVSEFLPKDVVSIVLQKKTQYERRIALKNTARFYQLQSLERLESLESLQRLQSLESLQRLQSLESLQRLERLESLQRLIVLNKNYNEVELPNGVVIYCDPPYKGTKEYREGGFNHNEFWDWVRETIKTQKVFISEYSAPPDFLKVLEFKRKSSLQGGTQKHNKQPNECVFLHESQIGLDKQTLF